MHTKLSRQERNLLPILVLRCRLSGKPFTEKPERYFHSFTLDVDATAFFHFESCDRIQKDFGGEAYLNLSCCKSESRIKARNTYRELSAASPPSPVDSIRDATLTVSPNKQYRGMVIPTTPATHGPDNRNRLSHLIVQTSVSAFSVWKNIDTNQNGSRCECLVFDRAYGVW